MEDMESNKVYHKCKPVCIGSNVWIGNHVSITKGTVIADGCIVASCSVVNKQFHTANTLIAGVPAQEKKKGLKRIFSYERELALDKLFD